MLIDTKARVGVFAIALGAYLPQFPSLVPEFEAQYAAFKQTLPGSVELIDGGIVTTKELAMAAGDKFRAADVDLVILQLLTIAIPALEEMHKDEDGRKKIQQYTRYVTVALAVLESGAMAPLSDIPGEELLYALYDCPQEVRRAVLRNKKTGRNFCRTAAFLPVTSGRFRISSVCQI